MSTTPPPGSGASGSGAARRIEEAMQRIEAELRQAIAYVNDTVVPQVRRESVSTMRTLSETLRKLADRIETNTPSAKNPSDRSNAEGPRS